MSLQGPLQGPLRASRLVARPPVLRLPARRAAVAAPRCAAAALVPARRLVAPSPARLKGIMPHTDDPAKSGVSRSEPSYGVVDLAEAEYHERADAYLDAVVAKFEHLQDTREDIDIEYSAGVMTITVADKGTYVINKQPPNKQIWLSSPISGPKRYDWCMVGESQGEKEGSGSGDWIYTRDGNSLSQLILNELGVSVAEPAEV